MKIRISHFRIPQNKTSHNFTSLNICLGKFNYKQNYPMKLNENSIKSVIHNIFLVRNGDRMI